MPTVTNIKELGRGAFSFVYLGHLSDKPKELYAIKTFNKVSVNTQLKFEIQLHAELQHLNIVAFKEVHCSKEKIYIFLEYMPDGDLCDYLNRNSKNISVKAIESFLLDIVQGLHYLHHDRKILHLDIKLENIVLNGNIAKITDFGFATRISNAKNLGLCGTPNRVAPEIWSRIKQDHEQQPPNLDTKINYTKAIDLFALGVICWEIVHLSNAYSEYIGKNSEMILHELANHVLQHPLLLQTHPTKTHLSYQWMEIMRNCLSLNPKQRPTTKAIIDRVLSSSNRYRLMSLTQNAQPITLEQQPSTTTSLKNPSGSCSFWNNRNQPYLARTYEKKISECNLNT